ILQMIIVGIALVACYKSKSRDKICKMSSCDIHTESAQTAVRPAPKKKPAKQLSESQSVDAKRKEIAEVCGVIAGLPKSFQDAG
ncbi:MAG: hypothetical protein V4516_06230, partial [Pseudomonadota bacterium]